MSELQFKRGATRIRSFEIQQKDGQPVTEIKYETKILNPQKDTYNKFVWRDQEIKSNEPGYSDTVTALCKVTGLGDIISWAEKEYARGLNRIRRDSSGIATGFIAPRELHLESGGSGVPVETTTTNGSFLLFSDRNYLRINAHSKEYRNILDGFYDIRIRSDSITLSSEEEGGGIQFDLRRKKSSQIGFMDALGKGDKAHLRQLIADASASAEEERLDADATAKLREAALSLLCDDAHPQIYDMARHHIEAFEASRKLSRRRW